MTRALIAARLSRNAGAEESSRIERDDESAGKWAEGQGLTVVAVSKDKGVSGGTSPFDRGGLGPWLTDPLYMSKYDVLVASSIDRLGRNAADLFKLREWAEENGKSIRVLSPSMSWPPAPDDLAGPIVWDVLGRVAELELNLITKRHADARETVRANGAFYGKPPFGFAVVGERYNKRLELRPELAPVLRGMVDRALRGDTYTSIAQWLDESGVPSVHGKPWSQTSVRVVLSSPALKGRYLDGDGKVIHKFDGIMTAAEWKQLQQALDRRPQRRGLIKAESAMLTGIVHCEHCGRPMYRTKSKRAKKDGTVSTWFYYRCGGTDRDRSTCRNMVMVDYVDTWLNLLFSNDKTELVEIQSIPGDDHAEAIAETEQEIHALDLDASDYAQRHRELMAERARLKALPVEPAQVVEVPTGLTVADVWLGLTDSARRRYLAAAGVEVRVSVIKEGEWTDMPDGRHLVTMRGNPDQITGTLRQIEASDDFDPTAKDALAKVGKYVDGERARRAKAK